MRKRLALAALPILLAVTSAQAQFPGRYCNNRIYVETFLFTAEIRGANMRYTHFGRFVNHSPAPIRYTVSFSLGVLSHLPPSALAVLGPGDRVDVPLAYQEVPYTGSITPMGMLSIYQPTAPVMAGATTVTCQN